MNDNSGWVNWLCYIHLKIPVIKIFIIHNLTLDITIQTIKNWCLEESDMYQANHGLHSKYLINIANSFNHSGSIKNVQPLGSGNINDTFLIKKNEPEESSFVLQKINTQVFSQPELIMQNMAVLNDHVQTKQKQPKCDRQWQLPAVIKTKTGKNYTCQEDNSFWRAISFIDNSESVDTITNSEQAEEIGIALGIFHDLISDLAPEKLADTLPGFHITPIYLKQYQKILAHNTVADSPEKQFCLEFVENRQHLAYVLENAKSTGKIPLRLMHGDPKVNNVLFDKNTKKAISVIDLDTIKPGLIHYDIGDCLRSGCNLRGEETQDWEQVNFDLDLCENILQGYLQAAKTFLTPNDYQYIYSAIRLIAFELGLRFFSDYLAGNVYFKVNYPEHNLMRALVQFKLTQSIESQDKRINQIIAQLS
jgi:Ser/Thr protein kinase RdoA (MazF antagonist)